MTRLVLANRDYGPSADGWGAHMTDEGYQLQAGLEHAGWVLAGAGYGDGCRHVPTLIDRFNPSMVFVQDVRDWLAGSDISFRKDIEFTGLEALKDIPSFTVLKDAWGWQGMQARLAEQIGCDGIAHYYARDVIDHEAPWSVGYPKARIYQSIDADLCRSLWKQERSGRCVSGAASPVYPLRVCARHNRNELGLVLRKHPGYGNRGADTPGYLEWLSRFKVHVATGGKWGVAFRKIIESVALGVIPVTNLDPADVLPGIDGALIRIPTESTVEQIREALDRAEALWDHDERRAWAEAAWSFYDYRVAGKRLSDDLEKLCR